MPQFEFQIKTRTEAESERFMQAIGAEDVDIEPWIYDQGTPNEREECCAFGVTTLNPQELERLAAEHGVDLVHIEDVQAAEREADELIQRVMQASEIVSAMNPASEQERLRQMLETYQQLSEKPQS